MQAMGFDSHILDEIDAALRAGAADDRWRGWSWTQGQPGRVDIWRGGRIAHLALEREGEAYALSDADGREWWRGRDMGEMAVVARRVLLEG